MRAAIVIALKDLRERFRDRSAFVLGFLAPLGIGLLMSNAFAGAEDIEIKLAFVDDDHGQLAVALRQAFDEPGLADLTDVVVFESRAKARAAVDDGEVGAAIIVPRGFSAGVTGSDPQALSVLTSTNADVAGQVVGAIAEGFAAQANANRLSVQTLALAAPQRLADTNLVEAVSALRLPVVIEDQPISARQLKAISYYGPAMGIFFLLFAIPVGARGFFGERANGTLDRIAAAPIRPAYVLAGKSLSVFVFGLMSLGTVVVATSVFFGAEWGNPIAVGALCVAMVLAVVALTALVIALARTERQAEGIASMVVFTLALLGGNFVVAAGMPETLRRLALATPNGWALRGFSDLAVGISATEAVVRPIAAIVAFSVLVGGLAAVLSRRLVVE